MNPTMEKFGYPATLVAEYRHWAVLARPQQATLGALVLAHKGSCGRLPEVGAEALAELALAGGQIEAALAAFRPFDKINYLLLMMVDPEVHFHVLPRYAADQEFAGLTFRDEGWPGVPNLAGGHRLEPSALAELVARLRAAWPARH
jgi:diadenosine tetraphosphate (Ap4A) HIT family hydrolase